MRLSVATALVAALALAACETSTSFPYQPSTANIMTFQNTLQPSGTKVQLGTFSRDPSINTTPSCRMLGPVDVAPGKTLEAYLHDAMQAELFQAGVYDQNARATLAGRLDAINLDSIGTGSWTLTLTLSSNLDPTGYQTTTTYPFSSSWSAASACENAAAAFGPAVNALIAQVIANPKFRQVAGAR